ncbi:hypothetical protein MBT84_26545 [Streptomyces sp. MBT84]|nr:hypothetical protein [Streptomyces sp. MBT84]
MERRPLHAHGYLEPHPLSSGAMRIPVVHHAALRRRAVRHRFVRSGGELLVTVGVVLILLVVHQLWWTNRDARQGAERKVQALERE